jgi:hypothetical protein
LEEQFCIIATVPIIFTGRQLMIALMTGTS